jgi:carbon storage regulator
VATGILIVPYGLALAGNALASKPMLAAKIPIRFQRSEAIMLILTRRTGERIRIGDSVTVAVLGVHGNQVRIGLEAPRELTVHRVEVFERIRSAGPLRPPHRAVDSET